MRLVPLALALATAGTASCNRDLSVPDGSASPPGLSSVTPAKAFSGTLVTLRGHDLGSNPSLVNIRFGTSADVHPLKITADQTAAQVVVPDDAASGEVQLATALGQSTLTNAFVWPGPGRLLHRELALTSNLQQSVQPFPLPGRGQVALYSAWWSALHVLDADGTEHRPDANDVEVAATYDDGAGLLSISLGSEDPGCPALSLWDFPASGAPQKTCLPTTPPPLDVPDYLAASPDGKLIAAASPDLVTLID
ncbi:MAG: IPT/TIG domain-containing protein, partial [Deltaproteobacteria bacterium]|nr:IPT/TIG domain-containing protein [Deltaproteobacteria bacterium]